MDCKIYKKMKYSFACLLLISTLAQSQNTILPNGPVYTAQEIPKVHIIINPDSLEDLYLEENWYSDYEYRADFVFETISGSDTVTDIGLRFRGNTSRDKAKKSFKVSFNTYVAGRKYQGFEKLNLNAETNDPSMLRSRLMWDLLKEKGVKSSRSNHVEVFINGDYYGLYQNIEHIDEEFVESWFGNNSGNLYKCLYPANLDYISDDPEDYKLAPFGGRTYELKTNTTQDDYSDLAAFIEFLNQSSDYEFDCDIESYFNVYSYLKIAAIDVLTGNWDGYIYNQNNFYLYFNPLTRQFEYIPYDLDNTWGIDWLDRNWGNRNIYDWAQGGQPRPLFNRLMEIEKFRNVFSWHIRDIIVNNFGTVVHLDEIQNLQDFIAPSAIADLYRPLDFDFDISDFYDALTEADGGHVEYGIFPFIAERRSSAIEQVENIPIPPIISTIVEDFSSFPDSLLIKVFLDGPATSSIEMYFNIGDGGGAFQPPVYFEDSLAIFTLPVAEWSEGISYNIQATGFDGLVRSSSCNMHFVLFSTNPNRLVINEVMTSNSSTIFDEMNEAEDWIELYNPGNSPVNLGDFYLSDNNTAPCKWRLPDIVVDPGEFLLFWADGETDEGSFHTNFKLSAQGERLYLFHKSGSFKTMYDVIDIPTLPTDFSYGRQMDAGSPWILFAQSTPDATNYPLSIIDPSAEADFLPYPNPTKDILNFEGVKSYTVHDLVGKSLKTGRGSSLSMQEFPEGVYIVELGAKVYKVIKQ